LNLFWGLLIVIKLWIFLQGGRDTTFILIILFAFKFYLNLWSNFNFFVNLFRPWNFSQKIFKANCSSLTSTLVRPPD
jgi:hypothetical protein